MFGSNPRLKIARPNDGIRSTENRLHPVASSSSISPALSTVAPGICSRPSRNRADASISGLISRGDLYSGPSSRSSTRSIARLARRMHETREFPRVLGDRGVAPLLAQLRHLRGLAGDHPGTRRILASGCGAAASRAAGRCRDRTAAPPPWTAWAARRAPRTPAPGRRTDPRRPPARSTSRASTAGGGSSSGSSQHLDLRVGMLAPLALQPVVRAAPVRRATTPMPARARRRWR